MLCDLCGRKRKRNYVTQRWKPYMTRLGAKSDESVRVEAEVIVAVNGVWDGGELCGDCLLDLVGERRHLERG